MGFLTESMTRLRDEILVLRHNRQTLRTELARSTKSAQLRVSGLRMVIASDLAGARRAWRGSVSGGGQSAGADRPSRVAGATRESHSVTRQRSAQERDDARIPARPAVPHAPAASTGKFRPKKRRKP